jgi:hypothetical protein
MKKTQLLFFVCIISILNRAYCQWYPELRNNLEIINKIETINYNDKGDVSNKKEISWYDNGKIKKNELYEGGEVIRAFSYSYIEGKRKQEIRKTVTPANVIMYTVNTFDREGNLKKSKSYSSRRKNSYHVQSNFKYDEFGRVTSLKVTSINGKHKSQADFIVTYPDETTVKRETIRDGQKEFDWIIKYDSTSKMGLVETISYEKPSNLEENRKEKKIHNILEPPKEGWVKRDTINEGGKAKVVDMRIHRLSFYYDDKGNWTEMYEVQKDGTEQLKAKRKIEYNFE